MGIKLSKQTTTEPYPKSYHGSSTGFAEPKDNWILVQSSKLNKMKKKLRLKKDVESTTAFVCADTATGLLVEWVWGKIVSLVVLGSGAVTLRRSSTSIASKSNTDNSQDMVQS